MAYQETYAKFDESSKTLTGFDTWPTAIASYDTSHDYGLRTYWHKSADGAGKHYIEVWINTLGAGCRFSLGIVHPAWNRDSIVGGDATSYGFQYVSGAGRVSHDGTNVTRGGINAALTTSNHLMMAVDFTNGKIWFGMDSTWHDSGDPATGVNPNFTFNPSGDWYFGATVANVDFEIAFSDNNQWYTAPTDYSEFDPAWIYEIVTSIQPPDLAQLDPANPAVVSGTSVTVSINDIPADCSVGGIVLDGTEIDYTDSTYTFSNVISDHDFTYLLDTPQVSVLSFVNDSSGGSISPSGDNSVTYGGNWSGSVTLNSGWFVDYWIVNDETVSTHGVTNSQQNIMTDYTIEAVLAQGQKITSSAESGNHGTISPDGISYIYLGNDKTYTVSPAADQTISQFHIDGTYVQGDSSHIFLNVQSDHSIQVGFKPGRDAYGQLTTQGGLLIYGVGNLQAQNNTYDYNRRLGKCNIGHSSGKYYFEVYISTYSSSRDSEIGLSTAALAWVRNGGLGMNDANGYGKSDGVGITGWGGNMYYDGTYGGTASLNFSNGATFMIAVDCDAGKVWFGRNGTQFLSGNPATGANPVFSTIGGKTQYPTLAVGYGNTFWIKFKPSSHSYTAPSGFGAYSSTNYFITTSVNDGSLGTILPFNPQALIGNNLDVTITPSDLTNTLDHLVVDGTTMVADTTYSFTNLQADHSIEAFFGGEGSGWVITSTINDSNMGSITPLGETQVIDGSSQDFTIIANLVDSTIYEIESVVVDGTNMGAISYYEFLDVTANHSIDATLDVWGYIIDTTIDPNKGSIIPAGDISAQAGMSTDITVVPVEDFTVYDLKIDGTSMGSLLTWTFNDVSSGHTAIAYLRNACYIVTLQDTSNPAVSNPNELTANLMLHLKNVRTLDDQNNPKNWTDITSYDFTLDRLDYTSFDGSNIVLDLYNIDFSNFEVEFITE